MILIAGLIFFLNLGGPKLWDRDEPRNAGCAAEMLERGDWVVPMFNAELRVHKPVLLYWFMMTAYAVFGVSEFAARFWSAVCGLGTVLATYHIGRRLFSAEIGFWAAVILSSCMMFPVAARAATPDSVLIFFVTLATLVYVYGAFPPGEMPSSASAPEGRALATAYFPRRWTHVALMYALMGVAVLAKGPVGLVLPTAIIGMFLLVVRLPARESFRVRPRYLAGRVLLGCLRPFAPRHFLATCWSMRPLTALGVSLAVALPWYLWVGIRTGGEWPKGFFLVHNLHRAMAPMEGHDAPFFYYLIVIMLAFFPWSLLLLPTIAETARRLRERHAWYAQYVFVACWGAVYVVAFSFARTKLPSYISPSLPAFALLTACFVQQWPVQSRGAHLAWLRQAFIVLFVVGVALVIGIPIASRRFLPGDGWMGVIGLVPILGSVAGWFFLRRFCWNKALGALATTAVAFACTLFSLVSVEVSRHQQIDTLFRAVYTKTSQPEIAAYGCFEPSWAFYARRPIRFLAPNNPAEAARFLDQGGTRFLVTSDRHWEALRPLLKAKVGVLARVPYFLRRGDLIVLAR
jgi:4-amino-4-deoxy-L-arabinose transferase-like glycosyltransferase